MRAYWNSCHSIRANGLMIGLLAGCSLFIMADPAVAQQASSPVKPSKTVPAPIAQPGQQNLDAIVVTAQRRSQRLQDVPLTVVALTSNDLAKAGVSSVRNLGSVVAGFTFGGLGSTSQPAIRGVTTTISGGGAENPNALYVDGIYQQASVALNNELPDVERIEVLKGPQGTLFGRNATGGAIQIFTRGPSFTPQASVTIEPSYYTGSGSSRAAPHVSAKAFVTGAIAPDLLAASISGGYTWTPGYQTNDATGKRDGKLRTTTLRGKILLTPASNFSVTAGAYYINDNFDGLVLGTPYEGLTAASGYAGTVIPTEPWHSAYDNPPLSSSTRLKQHGGFVRAELKTGAGLFTSLTGYTKTTGGSAAPIAYAQSTLPCLLNFACIDSYNVLATREVSQELNFASKEFGIFSFVGGLYYYNSRQTITAGLDKILAPVVPGFFPLIIQQSIFRTKSYAAYGEATIKPTERLSLILGARYNHEPHDDTNVLAPVGSAARSKSKNFNSFTPRASARYKVTDELNAYATVSVGERSGLTGISNTQSNPPFAPVDPEKLISYEVGLKYATHDLSVNASAFYYNYRNKQEQSFSGTGAIVQNTGPVRIYGLDLDARARLTPALNLQGNLSWIPVAKYLDFPDASATSTTRIPFNPALPPFDCAPFGSCGGFPTYTFDATGQRLVRAPKLTASGTLSYNSGPFDASATVGYSSTVLLDIAGVIRQPGYATLTAQAGYTFNGRMRIGVFGRNLTNKAYIANGLSSIAGFGVGYGAPREIGLSFSYNY